MRNLVIAGLIQFALLARAQAWGREGHSIVAGIAQRRLTPEAAAKVREILRRIGRIGAIIYECRGTLRVQRGPGLVSRFRIAG